MADVDSLPRHEMRDSQVQADDDHNEGDKHLQQEHAVTQEHKDEPNTQLAAATEALTEQQQQTDEPAGHIPKDVKGKAKEVIEHVAIQPHDVEFSKEGAGDKEQAADDSQAHDSFERAGSGPPSDEAEIHEMSASTHDDAPAWAMGLFAAVSKVQLGLDSVSTRLESLESLLGAMRQAPTTAVVKSGKYVTPDKPRPDSDPFLDTIHIEVLRNMSLLSNHCNEFKASEAEAARRFTAIRQSTWGLRKQLLKMEHAFSAALTNRQTPATIANGGGAEGGEATPRYVAKNASDEEDEAATESDVHEAPITVVDAEAGPAEAGPSEAIPTGPRSSNNRGGGRGGRVGRGRGRGRRGRGRGRGGPRSDANARVGGASEQSQSEPIMETTGIAIVTSEAGVGEE